MNSFRKKIKELCLELSGLPGGVHWGLYLPRSEAPWQDYLVLVPGEGPIETEDTGDTTIELRSIRFQFYTSSLKTGGTLVEALYKKMRKLETILSDGNRIIGGYKVDDTALLDPNRWYDGTEVWLSLLSFEFFVQRTVVPV